MFRIRTALAGAAVAAVAVLAFAAPASAHDALVSSSPAADEQVTTVPEQISLTFSNNLLVLEDNSGTAMTVVDDAGRDWVAGEPEVEADTVTAELESGMPNGSYDVTWKIVSSDGHPTSGEYSFTVAAEGNDATPEPTETATTPEESATPVAETPAAETPAPAPAETDAAPWPLLIGLGVVVLIAIIVVIVIAARKKR